MVSILKPWMSKWQRLSKLNCSFNTIESSHDYFSIYSIYLQQPPLHQTEMLLAVATCLRVHVLTVFASVHINFHYRGTGFGEVSAYI